jgi:hypothetical protein
MRTARPLRSSQKRLSRLECPTSFHKIRQSYGFREKLNAAVLDASRMSALILIQIWTYFLSYGKFCHYHLRIEL